MSPSGPIVAKLMFNPKPTVGRGWGGWSCPNHSFVPSYEKGFPMLNFRRASVVTAAVAGLVCVIWCVALAQSQQPTATDAPAVSKENSLAARYHLRTRTSRFFRRAASPSRSSGVNVRMRRGSRLRHVGAIDREDSQELAARYHLRKRTSKFFDRSKQVAARYHLRKRSSRFFDRSKQLAARYHLRGRTDRFFGRVTV